MNQRLGPRREEGNREEYPREANETIILPFDRSESSIVDVHACRFFKSVIILRRGYYRGRSNARYL